MEFWGAIIKSINLIINVPSVAYLNYYNVAVKGKFDIQKLEVLKHSSCRSIENVIRISDHI